MRPRISRCSGLIVFTATLRPSATWVAERITPMPPSPITSPVSSSVVDPADSWASTAIARPPEVLIESGGMIVERSVSVSVASVSGATVSSHAMASLVAMLKHTLPRYSGQ